MADRNEVGERKSHEPSSDSGNGGRKFTQSCSRCRASKLKCDRTEPCMECVKRQVGHLCTKDERQPRTKRVKTDHIKEDENSSKSSPSQDTGADEVARLLEQFVTETPRVTTHPSAVSKSPSSLLMPDYPNAYWSETSNPQKHDEKFALLQEIVDALPEWDIIYLLYQVFITRCQGPMGNVVHTLSFMDQAELLRGCLSLTSTGDRVISLANTFSMDSLACFLLALSLSLAFHPTPNMLCWSYTTSSLHIQKLRASGVFATTWRTLALRCLRGKTSLFCGSVASLQAAVMLLLDGQEDSFTLDSTLAGAISGAQKLGLHRLGDARLNLPLSSSSFEGGSNPSTELSYVRIEVGVRIWWALVMRDWSRGQALGYYIISPSQFNTRRPLHINDEDLEPTAANWDVNGHIVEKPLDVFTMLSYTIHAIKLSGFARELVDLSLSSSKRQADKMTNDSEKTRERLNREYEKFVAELPSFFRVGSRAGLAGTGRMQAIPVHRWMLHQQLWSLFLKIYRSFPTPSDCRSPCYLFAQNIIGTQARIRKRCAVCGSLSTSATQLLNAAVTLLMGLLSFKGAHDSTDQLTRFMMREKVREALELLEAEGEFSGPSSSQNPSLDQAVATSERSAIALEALLKVEEEVSLTSEEANGASLTKDRTGKGERETTPTSTESVKEKVIDILEAFHATSKQAIVNMGGTNSDTCAALDMFAGFPTTFDGSSALNALPLLSEQPNYDFWPFLDIPPSQASSENDIYSTSAEQQTYVDSASLGSSSFIASTMGGFSAPDMSYMSSDSGGT